MTSRNHHSPRPAQTDPSRQPRTTTRFGLPFALVGVAAVLLAIGIIPRLHAASALTQQTQDTANTNVTVIAPSQAPAEQALLLAASVSPFADAAIYARTSGYLSHWYKDIGASVKAGDILATIDAPDLDAQWRQASADVATARAAYNYAKTTSERWQTMLQSQSVSAQDAEARLGDMQTKQAMLASAVANEQRLHELVSFEKVRAPFDGVVTARNVDVGALITAGGASGTASSTGELFHIEQFSTLRVFADVPQGDAAFVNADTTVYLSTAQYPGKQFPAKLARTTGSINPNSRTLHIEVDVDNTASLLMPGAYAQLHLGLRTTHPALELPVSAIMQRPDGVSVAIVDAQNKTAIKIVTVGRDFGTHLEITGGLGPTDRVINNPSDSITSGETVNIVSPSSTQS